MSEQGWRALYPFESRFFDRGDGIKLHYFDEGPGGPNAEPVVMVHGNPTWSFYYRELAEALKPAHRVLALDHVGMGLSDRPGEELYRYTLDSRVEDFGRWIEDRKLERFSLVVHDWGGMIALAWAVENPERIARLVVLNTAGFPLPAGKMLPWQLKLARTRAGRFLVQDINLFVQGAVWTCAKHGLDERERAGYLAPYGDRQRRLAVFRFVQDIPLGPKDAAWGTVHRTGAKLGAFAHAPVLVCWGARDFVFNDGFFGEWNRRLPKAEFHYFRDAGHLVLEDAGDRIIPLVESFLQRAPAVSASR